MARAWYTHVAAASLSRRLRMFSGKVSRRASTGDGPLRLEHFRRMQATLTRLVERHVRDGARDADEFIRTVIDGERVHVVTADENYAAMRAMGDYGEAGIVLLEWNALPPDRRRFLWKNVLNGRVANAADFAPR
jgi:hypothetical protein